MATRINLLPWRENLRKQREQQFGLIAAVAAGVMLVAGGMVHLYIGSQIDAQQTRNDFLQREIKLVDKKIKEIDALEKKKKQLLARMKVIQDLQSQRPMAVRMVDELVRLVPEGLYLTKVAQSNNVLTLNGVAQSNARVSALMREIDKSKWFEKPKLGVIQVVQQGSSRVSQFTMQVDQVIDGEKKPAEKTKKGKG